MFEEYLQDASLFLETAKKATTSRDEVMAKRYFRASIFCALSAMEAFVNYIADSFAKAQQLEPHELAYLNDRRIIFRPPQELSEITEYHSVDNKLRVLLARFLPTFDFDKSTWGQFMQFKDLRDSLIHPRAPEDNTHISAYLRDIPKGFKAIISLMDEVSRAVFHAPLRRQLLDLIPE